MMKEFLPSCAICDLYPIYFIPRWAFVGLACQEWHDASASVELPTSLNLGTRNALYRSQCFSTYKYFSIMQTVWLVLPQQHQQHWGVFLSKLCLTEMFQTSPHSQAQRHKELEVTADFVLLCTSRVQVWCLFQGGAHGEISTAVHELVVVFHSKFVLGCSGKPIPASMNSCIFKCWVKYPTDQNMHFSLHKNKWNY